MSRGHFLSFSDSIDPPQGSGHLIPMSAGNVSRLEEPIRNGRVSECHKSETRSHGGEIVSAVEPIFELRAHPTLDHLNALGLYGLAKGFKELEHKAEARSLSQAA